MTLAVAWCFSAWWEFLLTISRMILASNITALRAHDFQIDFQHVKAYPLASWVSEFRACFELTTASGHGRFHLIIRRIKWPSENGDLGQLKIVSHNVLLKTTANGQDASWKPTQTVHVYWF
ncbi:hypothetical protein QBC37DRAFT_431725 [Rhypophila decipiens]|uniref:Secreted protein n=1 Tax=Rhypophila decipiens TaxID=261697 RepID=A0AAN7B0Y1_9PEZI|nr:hypothetical protein QBC37DRAFT_431725 [Rhypophila decipiens]